MRREPPARGSRGPGVLSQDSDFLPKCLDFLQPAPAAAERDRASGSRRRPPPPRHMVARPFLRRARLPRLARPRRARDGIMPSGPPGPGEWQGDGAAGRARWGAARPPAPLRAPDVPALPECTTPGVWGSAGLARPPRGSASAALERAFSCSAEATRVRGGGMRLRRNAPVPGQGPDSHRGALPVRGDVLPVRGGAFQVLLGTLPSGWGSLLFFSGALPAHWGALLRLPGTFPVLRGSLPATLEGAGTHRRIVSAAAEESSAGPGLDMALPSRPQTIYLKQKKSKGVGNPTWEPRSTLYFLLVPFGGPAAF